MDRKNISWLRLGLLRFALGLLGLTAGLALGALFLVIWHCVSWAVLAMFGVSVAGWIYAWDSFFAVVLFREGYRYKAGMPPESPFTKGETLLMRNAAEVEVFRTEQAAFAISEILYVAPRFLFWGIRHLRRIEWPSTEMAGAAERIYGALQTAGTWVPYDELLRLGSSKEESAHALAMLVRAELAEPRFHDGVASFRTAEPEWI
jgi:hypothetical protein